jgi:diguanylate cyclase (GGDEF)-like protein
MNQEVYREARERSDSEISELAHYAGHDALSGLPNRLLLNDRLGQAILRASHDKSLAAVLFLDLDGYKRICDSLGLRTGDKLLESVARRLQQCVRLQDTVCRLGPDEFVVMLSDLQNPEDAAIAARRILSAVRRPHLIASQEINVTASIGISIFPDDGPDAATVIQNADTAMYQAKVNGRQTFKFFKPEMNALAEERQAIEEDLRGALERRELALRYQPKIDLKSETITGVEALLRWTHPARGKVPPALFIPIAENSGLMLPIGSWVLREACKQAKAWAKAGLPPMTMAVNVSAVQLRSEGFVNEVKAILSETGLDPKLFEIEISESALMKGSEQTSRMFRILRERGIRISIGDFGTGYSSLSCVAKLPLDGLKIHQSFIREISTTPAHKAIVSAIISMARNLGLRVTAEGVETIEELAFLKEQGCDEAQGYFFNRALPADFLARMLDYVIA